MTLSRSHLFLVLVTGAITIGWCCDHMRLRDAIERLNDTNTELNDANTRLNAEATALFSDRMMHRQTISTLDFPDGQLPPSRTYVFSNPEDRAEYLKTYGHIGK